MLYKINEIFRSIQGEGFYTGTPTIFIRFSGCNLSCEFCDTKHETFKEMNIPDIVRETLHLIEITPVNDCVFYHICFTGGESLLNNLDPLVQALEELSGYIFTHTIETNGTIQPSEFLMNTCHFSVSPKVPSNMIANFRRILNLKVLFPFLSDMEAKTFNYLHYQWKGIQPIIIGNEEVDNITLKEAQDWIYKNPTWRLSTQLHKLIGVQ